MAIYRYIHTCFWEDDKVVDEMDLKDKFFYLYLLTNGRVKQCGCYDISWKKITFETTLSKKEIEIMLKKFENKYNLIKYDEKTKEILLLNFYKYNWTSSPKVKSCIEKELKEIKAKSFIEYIKKMIQYKYGTDTVCIQLGEKEKEKEKEKENKKRENKRESKSSLHCDFVAPTLADILTYSNELEIEDKEYCEKFYNHYGSIGWVNGTGQQIKNWKLVFNNWLKKDNVQKQKKEEYNTRKFFTDEEGRLFKYDSKGVKHYV